MGKPQLLKYLAEGLKYVLGMAMDSSSQQTIDAAVEMFIIENVSKYSEQELKTNFNTMEKGLNLFMEYLESNLLIDTDTTTLH